MICDVISMICSASDVKGWKMRCLVRNCKTVPENGLIFGPISRPMTDRSSIIKAVEKAVAHITADVYTSFAKNAN